MTAADPLSDAARLRGTLNDPRQVCAALDLLRGSRRQRAGLLIRCPFHDEKTASCSVTLGDDDTIRVRCFGCGSTGDVLTLVAAARRLDPTTEFREILAEAGRVAGAPVTAAAHERPRARPPPRLAPERFAAIVAPLMHVGRLDDSPLARDVADYVARRGLLAEARREGWFALARPGSAQEGWLDLLADTIDEEELLASGLVRRDGHRLVFTYPEHRLVIPWRGPDGTVETVQRRRLDDATPKYVFPQGRAPCWPYGVDQARDDDTSPIVYVEGAVDVLARRLLEERLGCGRLVLGVPGVDTFTRAWAALARGRVAIIATDRDAAGERSVARWAAELHEAGATRVQRATPLRHKDWAEVLAELRAS